MTDDTTPAPAPAPARRRKKPAQNPVLPEHRLLFAKHLAAWQPKLGLGDWRINLSAKRPTGDNAADVECYWADHLARVRLADDLGGTAPTSENLEALAVHELMHIRLAGLVDQESSGLEGDALAGAEHQVIHVIVRLLTGTQI